MSEPHPLAAALLDWFARDARDLPWRRTRDPYRIWVSEVMLQQTQVETVRPYYSRFLERFPTLADLAAAPLDEVLAQWQGLGYYRRARGLHAAARTVVERHGGALPADLEALRALPGVGDYTAGAVASIAFGIAAPAIDGNVNRVLTRLFAIEGDPRKGEPKRRVRETAETLLPAAQPGDFNQALMELGARICTPAAPACGRCPVSAFCAAFERGEQERFPEHEAAPPPRQRRHVAAVIDSPAGRLFAQRPAEGRWGGLWELPRVELDPAADPAAGLSAGLRESLGVEVSVGAVLATLRHGVSGESIVLEARRATIERGEPQPLGYQAVRWVTDPSTLTLPTPQRRLLAALDQQTLPGV